MVELVLIDDDVLIHGTWKMVAKSKKHQLVCFLNLKDFLAANIPQHTPIYVDYHFLSGENGADICRQLIEKGFEHLYIATGSANKVSNLPPEVKAVMGKDYPL